MYSSFSESIETEKSDDYDGVFSDKDDMSWKQPTPEECSNERKQNIIWFPQQILHDHHGKNSQK